MNATLRVMRASERIGEAEALAAEAIGDVIRFWGFREILGRTWTLLYLSPDPLTAKQIREKLDASVGNTSMALTELRKWGVVKKVWLPGERAGPRPAPGRAARWVAPRPGTPGRPVRGPPNPYRARPPAARPPRPR